jgi:PAS domain S-box-containing protein
VSSVSDYAIFLLDVDGHIASWNRGAERVKGYRADEIIGQHFSAFYTEEDRREEVPRQALATAREQGRWESEGWRVRKDGSRFWANVVITALRGDDGGLRGFAKVTRDLADRKRNEDALRGILEREREAAEQLRGVDRMRRELVTMVAHDLRGPISVVQNLLDLLLVQWDDLADDDRRARVDRARLRAEVLGDLADDIFDVALIDAGSLEVTPEAIDLGAIVSEVVEDAEAVADGRTPIRATVDEHVVAVGDRRRTWQIVSNLVSNAGKFSPPDEPVEVKAWCEGGKAIVSVHDAGPGIPGPDQERIFDRFIRLRGASRTPGSGLGLFIARSLAEAQGGHITLDSGEGRGTTFTLFLPGGDR